MSAFFIAYESEDCGSTVDDRDAANDLDPGAGQRAPSARIQCEQRWNYCQGFEPDHFGGTSQGRHTEASIKKDCEASENDLIRRSSSWAEG